MLLLYQGIEMFRFIYCLKERQLKTVSDEIKEVLNQNINTIYQIRLKGHLGAQWSEWFNGMTITLENSGNTLLTGIITDQPQLHGLLKKIRDLGMILLSINYIKSDYIKSDEIKNK